MPTPPQQSSSPSSRRASSEESDDSSDFQSSFPREAGVAKRTSYTNNLKVNDSTENKNIATVVQKEKYNKMSDSKRKISDLLTDPATATTFISTSTARTTKRHEEQFALEYEAEEEARRRRPRFSELRKQIVRPMPAATKKLHEAYIARDDAAWDALGILSNKSERKPENKSGIKPQRTK